MIAPILKGRKTTLKPMEPKHAPVRYKWYRDPKVGKYQDFNFSSVEAIRKNIIKRRRGKDSIPWIIFTKESKLIGEIQLRSIDHYHKCAVLGMNIGETEFWNKGYGTNALHTVCKYFFSKLKYNRIELSVRNENTAAVKIYKKCGFKKEGVRRGYARKGNKYYDMTLMSLIKKDYKK